MSMTKQKSNLELNNYSKLFEFVTNKQFALARLGITDKMSFDWRKAGIYLQEKKTKFRMKYSPVEYIWLLLVKELREFGIPIKSVIQLKEFLITKIDIEGLLLAIHDDKTDSDTLMLQELTTENEEIAVSKAAIKKEIIQLDDHIVNSMFTSMVISSLIKEQEYILYIQKDGACLIETIGEDRNADNAFLSDPCLMIPFNKIVGRFLSKENINLFEKKTEDKITQSFDFKFLDKEPNKSKKGNKA